VGQTARIEVQLQVAKEKLGVPAAASPASCCAAGWKLTDPRISR